ncbi:putative Nitrogen fixation protein nifU [Hibiscus syriacus]|uniref:Nitrogen fixation protein nifU n=1 Tax=Hibiscus syriacus TaxID=106335 RepID=A0A6A2XM79_HIBSY|nr:uncharacterized protein LOC120193227 [Hibiscus syriacus]KAE8657567.1 putative Nitrogen fixation protein nifU [Hibiscus syriacus]
MDHRDLRMKKIEEFIIDLSRFEAFPEETKVEIVFKGLKRHSITLNATKLSFPNKPEKFFNDNSSGTLPWHLFHRTSWVRTFSDQPPAKSYRKEDDQRENNTHHREVIDTLKKLETELEETKAELKLLKERESETEIALASLNAELHKNMSKLAIAEDAAAKKAADTTSMPRTVSLEMGKGEDIASEEARRKELMKRKENNPTLSQILSIGEKEGYFAGKRETKLMKKKPIVPLVGGWIFKKKLIIYMLM